MDKNQRLRNAAEGFMAGLAVNGYTGPIPDRGNWEFAFSKAWRGWAPKDHNPKDFPKFGISAYRGISEPRNMIWELKRTSPFHHHEEGVNPQPNGMDPKEYLEVAVSGATPDEWVELAASFLREMKISS